MRDAFAKEMTELAGWMHNLVLLSGDIGNRMFDNFKDIAPERFINCGIAEANMMSMACGMALSGLRPVVYTIAPFTTTRCFEQIRVGAAYHEAPVVIVGTGAGLSYAELGPTHHSLEDIAILRSLPGFNVLAPADSSELVDQLREALQAKGPSYIRIGKKGEPILHNKENSMGIGKANMLREGRDVLVIGIGPIISEAIDAASALESEGYSIAIASLGSIKPLDINFLQEMRSKHKLWITVEEHSCTGGMGSALMEWLEEEEIYDIRLRRIGTPDRFINILGNQSYTRAALGLNSHGIANKIRIELRNG